MGKARKQEQSTATAGAVGGAVAGAAAGGVLDELQPRGNAAAQAALAGAQAGGATGAAKEGPSEHTVFVDGTWQRPGEEYWDEDVRGAAQGLLGGDTEQTFSWYGGPNDARARRMAGRKLYREAALPTFERGQELNLVAHSHGGNVVGEMGAYADHRRDHVDLMSRAAEDTSIGGIGTDLAAYASLGMQLGGLGLEALSLQAEEVERHGGEELSATNGSLGLTDDQREAARDQMMAQLGEEAEALLADGRAVATGDAERFASEKAALEGADMGDAIFAQTPWLSEHANPLDSDLLSGIDRIDSFRNDDDKVVRGAQRMAGDQGRRITTDRELAEDGPEVHEHTWERDGGYAALHPSYDHSEPINDGDAFNEEYGAVIDPDRYDSEEEAAAARAKP